jgi:hypothetical protein
MILLRMPPFTNTHKQEINSSMATKMTASKHACKDLTYTIDLFFTLESDQKTKAR